jgi:hypothetical protein
MKRRTNMENVRTIQEVMEQAILDEAIEDKKSLWKFNKKNLTLTFIRRPWYEIDLERCKNPGEVMDWIFQLRWKNWVTPEVMSSFLREFEKVFEEIFHTNAQALCPGGYNDMVADWKKGEIYDRKNKL